MNKDQATPRPWVVREYKGRMRYISPTSGFGLTIADTFLYSDNRLDNNYEANARLIVKAVNEYDNLKELLRTALPIVAHHEEYMGLTIAIEQALKKASE